MKNFIKSFDKLSQKVHEIAVAHGWWEQARNNGEVIALMHSELSEALEGIRHGDPQSKHIPDFTSVEEEMADIIIRIMDFGYSKNYRIAQAVVAKMAFNEKREYKHGGKKF